MANPFILYGSPGIIATGKPTVATNEKIFPVKLEKTLDFLRKVDIIIYALARYSGFV